MTRVVVAEDDTLLGQLVAALFQKAENLQIVGVAGDGEAALLAVEQHNPDLLLLDIHLPGLDGWEVLAGARERFPNVRVVMMSVDYTRHAVRRARELGAAEYLDKRTAAASLQEVLRRVAAGESWFQPHFSRQAGAPDRGAGSDRFELSDREREVLRLICAGRSNAEIAAELGISPHTAASHVSHILLKLDVSTRADAARIAVQRGLLTRR